MVTSPGIDYIIARTRQQLMISDLDIYNINTISNSIFKTYSTVLIPNIAAVTGDGRRWPKMISADGSLAPIRSTSYFPRPSFSEDAQKNTN